MVTRSVYKAMGIQGPTVQLLVMYTSTSVHNTLNKTNVFVFL